MEFQLPWNDQEYVCFSQDNVRKAHGFGTMRTLDEIQSDSSRRATSSVPSGALLTRRVALTDLLHHATKQRNGGNRRLEAQQQPRKRRRFSDRFKPIARAVKPRVSVAMTPSINPPFDQLEKSALVFLAVSIPRINALRGYIIENKSRPIFPIWTSWVSSTKYMANRIWCFRFLTNTSKRRANVQSKPGKITAQESSSAIALPPRRRTDLVARRRRSSLPCVI